MIQGSKMAATALLAAAGFLTVPALAQDAPPVNNGAVSLSGGVDITSQYWFRGIAQENQGIILQPYAEIGFDLYSDDDISVSLFTGVWNSFHASGGFSGGGSVSGGNGWYESDIYAGVGFASGNFEGAITYIDYYGPSGGGSFATEIALSIGYDDSGLWAENGMEGFTLAPSAVLAFELSGAADGAKEGIYLELGIEPNLDNLVDSADLPVSVSFPVTLGLSLDDYYENPTNGDDDFFGYLQLGAVASFPLTSYIGGEYGEWSAHAGVYIILLGDSAEAIAGGGTTGGESLEIFFSGGIGFEY